MADMRAIAKSVLAAVPERDGQIISTQPEFERLTGTSHATMKKNWDGGGIMTACNGFVGWYGRTLRGMVPDTAAPTAYLGRFDLATYLPTIGMGHAWVKSTATNWPKYGDICRHTAFHVGVSLDFVGERWEHADAGQGGKKVGYDILKRTLSKDAYDYTKLQGWIDIDIYYNTAPQTGKVPDWLQGWWNINWRGDNYYYLQHQSKSEVDRAEAGGHDIPAHLRRRRWLVHHRRQLGRDLVGIGLDGGILPVREQRRPHRRPIQRHGGHRGGQDVLRGTG